MSQQQAAQKRANINGLLPKSRCSGNPFIETLFELGQQGDEAFSEMPHHPDLNAHMTIWATPCQYRVS